MKTRDLLNFIALGILPGLVMAVGLEEAFRDPPPWTRPWCYWIWVDGDVTEDGITKDLVSGYLRQMKSELIPRGQLKSPLTFLPKNVPCWFKLADVIWSRARPASGGTRNLANRL